MQRDCIISFGHSLVEQQTEIEHVWTVCTMLPLLSHYNVGISLVACMYSKSNVINTLWLPSSNHMSMWVYLHLTLTVVARQIRYDMCYLWWRVLHGCTVFDCCLSTFHHWQPHTYVGWFHLLGNHHHKCSWQLHLRGVEFRLVRRTHCHSWWSELDSWQLKWRMMSQWCQCNNVCRDY